MTMDMKRKTRDMMMERSETQKKTEECLDDAYNLVLVTLEFSIHVSSDVIFRYSPRQTNAEYVSET